MTFGLPLGSHLATIGTNIGGKNTFSRRAPGRVPGKDLGSIFGGIGVICFGIIDIMFDVFFVSFVLLL